MTNIIGRLENVGIGVEATRGTAVAPTFWLGVDDKDYDDRPEVIFDQAAHGVLGEDSAATLVKQWADGGFKGKVYQNSIGAILVGLSGAASSTSVSSGEYTHTFTQANNVTNKSLTLAFKDANQDLAFANAVLDSVTFNLEIGKFFEYDAQFMSKKSASASNTVSKSAENLFAPKHGQVKIASAQSGLAAASAISLRKASITFAKNTETKDVLGSVDINDVHNKSLKVTGSLELYYDGTTYKDYVFNQTERALRIGVVNTDVTLANSSNPHLYFDLYKVRFDQWERSRGNNDIVTETVNFTALTDFSNSQKVYTIELLNGTAGTSYGN